MNNMKKLLAGITLGFMVFGGASLVVKSAEAFGGMHRDGMHRGGYNSRYTEMNDAQKADFKARHEQMLQWRKKDLQAAVDAGRLTQQEADARILIIQERFKAIEDGRYESVRGQRYANMTEAQKADFSARHEQMMNWHKKDLQTAVDAGRLTQQEADERISRINSRFKDMQDGKVGMHYGYGRRHGSKDDNYYRGSGYHHNRHAHNSDCPADCSR